MKPLTLAVLALLLWPTVALAAFCPMFIDQATAPFGTCASCTSPAGPIEHCPVTVNGSTLGCACQNVGNMVSCLDPNWQRCGGVLPWCSPLDLCVLNTATTCQLVTGLRADAQGCMIPGTGLVNPLACVCWLVTLKRPLSPEEKALHTRAFQALAAWAASALVIVVAPPSVPVSLMLMWKPAETVLAAAAVKALAIANDPPLPSFTTVTLPEDVLLPPYVVTTGDGLRPAQVDALNAASTLFSEIQAGEQAAMKSLFRASGAHEAASIAWYHQQLDAFDYAMAYLQPRYAQMAATMPAFCPSPIWAAKPANSQYPATMDYRPLYQASGMCDPLLAQDMLDLSTASLMSQR